MVNNRTLTRHERELGKEYASRVEGDGAKLSESPLLHDVRRELAELKRLAAVIVIQSQQRRRMLLLAPSDKPEPLPEGASRYCECRFCTLPIYPDNTDGLCDYWRETGCKHECNCICDCEDLSGTMGCVGSSIGHCACRLCEPPPLPDEATGYCACRFCTLPIYAGDTDGLCSWCRKPDCMHECICICDCDLNERALSPHELVFGTEFAGRVEGDGAKEAGSPSFTTQATDADAVFGTLRETAAQVARPRPPGVVVQTAPGNGLGLFAARDFTPGETCFWMSKGTWIERNAAERMRPEDMPTGLQHDSIVYVPGSRFAMVDRSMMEGNTECVWYRANHSRLYFNTTIKLLNGSRPVKERDIVWVATEHIRQGDELTFAYSGYIPPDGKTHQEPGAAHRQTPGGFGSTGGRGAAVAPRTSQAHRTVNGRRSDPLAAARLRPQATPLGTAIRSTNQTRARAPTMSTDQNHNAHR